MRRSNISFDADNTDYILFKTHNSRGTNIKDIDKRKRIMAKAIQSELTSRQRECIELYYFENIKMNCIADMLSLSPSTVTRHIKAGVKKLKNVAKYY